MKNPIPLKIFNTLFLLVVITFPTVITYSQGRIDAEDHQIDEIDYRTSKHVNRLTSPDKIKEHHPDKIVALLSIKPGMSICDIGAGLGQFTFKFAEALNGTGKVYATVTDKGSVDFLKKQSKLMGFDNVVPVKVDRQGLDNFYKRNSFDIIFLANGYDVLPEKNKFFKELRPALKADGRLYVLHSKDFDELQIDLAKDLEHIVNVFIDEGPSFPPYLGLSQESKDFILMREKDPHYKNAQAAEKFLSDISRILDDRYLLIDLTSYYRFKEQGNLYMTLRLRDSQHIPLIQWLANELNKERIIYHQFSPGIKVIEDNNARLRKLNSLLIAGIFQRNDWIVPRDELIIEHPNEIIENMIAAGFQYVRSFDISGWYYFLEFKCNDKK